MVVRPASRTERGSVLLVTVVVVVVVAAVTAAVARVGAEVTTRQRVQSVADVAALAAASQGAEAAHRVARANGGRVVALTRRSDSAIELKVLLGSASARAAAAMP